MIYQTLTEEQRQEWIKDLKEQKAFPYFKQTRYVHESGYRCFECGYLKFSNMRRGIVSDKYILGMCSDVIHTSKYFYKGNEVSASMDITKTGEIRLFSMESREYCLWWGGMDFVVSSAYICKLLPAKP